MELLTRPHFVGIDGQQKPTTPDEPEGLPTAMQLSRLLLDATGSVAGTSQRAQELALTERLHERHGADCITIKGVSKWFERQRIPGGWLMKIAALPKKPLNLADYA